MNTRWRAISSGLLFTAILLLQPLDGIGAQPAATVVKDKEVAIQPEAMAALTAMGNYLNTLKSFTVDSDVSIDQVLLDGQKILVTGTTRYSTRLPDRLRISTKIEEMDRDNEYFYDGKTFTIYGNQNKYYASFDAPPTIGKLLDLAEERYDVEIPLRDLFYWGTEKAPTENIKEAWLIDTVRVDGTPCKHLAFRQEDIDWQLWVEDDDTPLPRRLLITSKKEDGQPQYISTLKWDVEPQLNDSLFVFTPPDGAKKIEFAVFDDSEEPTKK